MVHLLHFFVGGIRGALALTDTIHLIRMVKYFPVPGGVRDPDGIINFHGLSIPMYSVRLLFGLPAAPPRLTDNLIITLSGSDYVALWVEETFVVQDYDALIVNYEEEKCLEPQIPGLQILSSGLVLISDISLLILHAKDPGLVKVADLARNGGMDPEYTRPKSPDSLLSDESGYGMSILSERADILALPEEHPLETSSIEVLTFQLIYSEYAVDLRYVRESILTREITPIPGTPDHILGIISVRGEIIPLIDLRILLNIPEKGLTDLNQVIILTDGVITFGILADQITGIRRIPIDQIESSIPDLSPKKPEYIFGIVPGPVIMIHASEILADPDMVVDDSAEPYVIPETSRNS